MYHKILPCSGGSSSDLDDSGVQEGVISSKRKRDDTLNQLYEFDTTQTYALNPIEHGLQTMDTWLTDMEGLFQAGVKDINFLPSQWDVLTFRSDIRTELFSKVFLNPNDLWVKEKEQEQLIGTMYYCGDFPNFRRKEFVVGVTVNEWETTNIPDINKGGGQRGDYNKRYLPY